MATTVTVTVKGDGTGDYTSLNAAEAGEERDLVTLDEIAAFECYPFTDNGWVTFTGYSTSASNYIHVYAAELPGGGWDDTKYILRETLGSQSYVLAGGSNFRVTGLQIEHDASGSTDIARCLSWGSVGSGGDGESADIRFDKCILRRGPNQTSTDSGNHAIRTGQVHGKFALTNCVLYGSWAADIANFGASGTGQLVLYNNTVYGGQSAGIHTGTWNSSFKVYAKNNVSVENGGTDLEFGSGTNTVDRATNLSNDGSEGSTVTTTADVAFVDAANGDFHIGSGSTAEDAGTDLSAVAVRPFTDDIDGETRSGTWDIGADEVVSSGISGSASLTLGGLSVAASGAAQVQATATPALGALSVDSVGTVAVEGQAAASFGALAADATATTQGTISGSASLTMGGLSVASTADVQVTGSAAPSFGAVATTSEADATVTGSADPLFGSLTAASTTDVLVSASADFNAPALMAGAQGGILVGSDGTLVLPALIVSSLESLPDPAVSSRSARHRLLLQ